MQLIKRNIKGEALTWDDVDSNWQAIESAINKHGKRKLYQAENITFSNNCSTNGESMINLSGSVKVLEAMDELPIIKVCIAVNNVIRMSGATVEVFIGCAFPFIAGTVSPPGTIYDFELAPDDYPARIVINIWDEKGNYAEPYTFTVEESQCPYINIENCSVVPDMTTFTRVLALTGSVIGSGYYGLQYADGEEWTTLASTQTANGELIFAIPISNDFQTGNVTIRVIDTANGNTSSSDTISFAFADWYAWHLFPECICEDGVQKFTIRNYLGATPTSSIAIEYETAPGIWGHIHTYTYSTPINLTVMGGGTLAVDVPEGTYNVRIRNLLTGKTLIAEDVVFPGCIIAPADITIETVDLICNEVSGYLRKLQLNATINTGSGNYKVQAFVVDDWVDVHEFSTEAGIIALDFYVPNAFMSGNYQMRIVDISDAENYSNSVETEIAFADSYTWDSEPEVICDGVTQQIQFSVIYTNIPEGELVVEVYNDGSWISLASTEYTTISASGTEDFGSPISLSEPLEGSYNVRIRNITTGSTLLATDINFNNCGV